MSITAGRFSSVQNSSGNKLKIFLACMSELSSILTVLWNACTNKYWIRKIVHNF